MKTPFVARFRLLRVGNTIALAKQDMARGFDADLLPWIGAYVMLRGTELMPASRWETAAEVVISGYCEEVTGGSDYSIEVRDPVIGVFPSDYSIRDSHVLKHRPF